MLNDLSGYQSILFGLAEGQMPDEHCKQPEFFSDLNLDQIVGEIVDGREEYNLKPFFYQGLREISSVKYRLEIMKELGDNELFDGVVDFSAKMKRIRKYIDFKSKVHNLYQRQKWLLDAAHLYCNSIMEINRVLAAAHLKSRGLSALRHWMEGYARSDSFRILYTDTMSLMEDLSRIRYKIQIETGKITIDTDTSSEDYCANMDKTFESISDRIFNYRIQFFTDLEMCDLEGKIIEQLRKMNVTVFDKLEGYSVKHEDFLEPAILLFERESQFYISYLEYMRKLQRLGLEFSYPELTPEKRMEVVGAYDLALAYKRKDSSVSVVPNDFVVEGVERAFVLTGPNQGGKTTFARAFGQILFLASIGCPVPSRSAKLFLFDRIFTHFSTEESFGSDSGRLKEELIRLNDILKRITPNSVVVLNELFTTTTSYDGCAMGKKILEYFISLDCICLYVTHIYELASICDRVVSLVATAIPGKDVIRTYRIARKPADGCAYANTIAAKYDLSYCRIKERIGNETIFAIQHL